MNPRGEIRHRTDTQRYANSYLPAFFLQKLVKFLEVPAEGGQRPESYAWGYIFCLGLLGSFLLEALVGNMMWFGECRTDFKNGVFD